jgi:hypothetical protein
MTLLRSQTEIASQLLLLIHRVRWETRARSLTDEIRKLLLMH